MTKWYLIAYKVISSYLEGVIIMNNKKFVLAIVCIINAFVNNAVENFYAGTKVSKSTINYG